jgi:two-component system, LytTR family, response regulator LytT
LDIMLKGSMSGVDVSEAVKTAYNIPVIFLTAYADQSTLDRAKVTEPFGYIIKPFKEIDLHTTIEMALYKHKKIVEIKKERDLYHSLVIDTKTSKTDIHFLKSNSKLIKLNTDDIWFIEALKDYVIVHTTSQKYMIHSTMKEIEAKLPNDVFLRVHRSFIIHIKKVQSIDTNTIVLEEDKKIIPIGGSYRDDLFKALNLF